MSILARILLLLLMLGAPRADAAYQTENVFVVVIDGLRNSEAFDDPTHQYIPRIWNDLRPQGSIIMGIEMLVDTNTVPGHFSIATGAWEEVVMDFNSNQRFRPNNPTFFEYYRKQLNIPADKTFFLYWHNREKVTTNRLTYSLHPLYGTDYGATFLSSDLALPDDEEVWITLQNLMDTYHPSLTFVNFKAVDASGHIGNWEDYLATIQTVDQIIYDLWQKIQSDPVYADKTTLFVTSDHGRHGDEFQGFQNHGLSLDDGCRIVPLLALGPDFAAGRQLSTRRMLIDIAPTVAELLGFKMPLAQGRVMHELFAANVNGSSQISSNPKIAVSNGTKYIARIITPTKLLDGHEQVFSFSAPVGTMNWSLPNKLSNNIIANTGDIASSAGSVHAVYNGWFPTDGSYANYEDWQDVYYTSSADQGNSWSMPKKISSPSARKGTPSIEVKGDLVLVASTANKTLEISRSTDRGVTWEAAYKNKTFFSYAVPEMAIDGTNVYMVLHGYEALGEDGNRDIYYTLSSDSGDKWTTPVRMTSDPSNQMNPDIAVGNGTQHLVWQSDMDGDWDVFYTRLQSGSSIWTQAISLSMSPAGAWQPKIVASGNKVLVAWIDYRDGNGNVYYRKSLDGGATWGNRTKLAPAPGFSEHLDITTDGSKVYFVWDDDRSGTWEIISSEVLF